MAVVGGVGIAGCGAGANSDPETDRSPTAGTSPPTTAPSETTRTRSESTDEAMTTVGIADVPSCPQKPATLTKENVAQFAMEFEEAYKPRALIQESQPSFRSYTYTYISLVIPYNAAGNITGTAVENGYLVEFSVKLREGVNYEDGTAVDGDLPYDVAYFIGSDSVHRIEKEYSEEPLPGPRESGQPVTCPISDE